MWKQCRTFALESGSLSDKEKEGITAICSGKRTYAGCADGRIHCYDDRRLYSLQAFELEFDYLESCDVPEKIVAIERLESGGVDELLVVGNERNLKVMRIRNKGATRDIIEGRLSECYDSVCVKECKNVHPCILNSLSLNNDEQYLLSSDYLKINLWKPERIDGCFTVVDIKPHKYSELTFVINSTKFSNEMNMVFGYSTSSGGIHINDLRVSSKSMETLRMEGAEMEGIEGAVRSISDFQFVDSSLIIARSLNSVALYDQRGTKHEVFTTVLCSDADEINAVYDSDAVYAKFRVSCTSMHGFTGGFGDCAHAINLVDGEKEDVFVSHLQKDSKKDKLKVVTSHRNGFIVVCEDRMMEYQQCE